MTEYFHTKGQKLTYIYDFGDDWMHTITLESITESSVAKASCMAGKGARPPEDCGGPWGYQLFKQTMADPKHPEYAEMREWVGLRKGQT